jgi:hypothetical protein
MRQADHQHPLRSIRRNQRGLGRESFSQVENIDPSIDRLFVGPRDDGSAGFATPGRNLLVGFTRQPGCSDVVETLDLENVRPIDIPTVFRDFDDYWSPFLGGQGPAPGYAMSLTEERRATLRERIRSTLPFEPDGSIHLTARAWAVRGTC